MATRTAGFVCAAGMLAACQSQIATAERELPNDKGPFASFGYRNMTPEPIPSTAMPQKPLADFAMCSDSAEKKQAASWIRDWFAAVSRLDQCDDWAIGALANARMRSNLLFILDRSGSHGGEETCKTATLDLFTQIEETQSLLQSWGRGTSAACNAARKREVADKREAAFKSEIGALDTALQSLKRQ